MFRGLDSFEVKVFPPVRGFLLAIKIITNRGPGILNNLGLASIYLSGAGLWANISREIKVPK